MKIRLTRLVPILFVFSLFLVSACEMSKTKISETLADHNRKALLEFKDIYETKTHPETADLVGASVTVFSVFLDSTIPVETATYLHQKISQNIQSKTLYAYHLSDKDLNNLLRQNGKLAQVKELYMDSLTVVSVSDKDISNPLGKYLNVDNFLVFQVDQWPCFDCKADPQIRMKLRLVDAETGFILWTAIAENKKISEKEGGNLMKLVDHLSDQMTKDFYNRFKKKWHRQRYDRLSETSG